jgi:hypothetical protein
MKMIQKVTLLLDGSYDTTILLIRVGFRCANEWDWQGPSNGTFRIGWHDMQIEASVGTASLNGCEDYFERLGSTVDRQWTKAHRNERAFAEVAAEALRDQPPSEHASLSDAVRLGLFAGALPFQEDLDATFGQPPLTVYWSYDFRVEILFWIEGVPGIHQHAFSGAFHVMHGSSLHTIWRYSRTSAFGSRLLFGDLALLRAELLPTGSTRPVVPGQEFIHSTYHLDRPSVSVVVRTNREEVHLPQYAYLPPSLGYDPRQPGHLKRRLQLLKMLKAAGRSSELLGMYLHLLETADPYSSLHYLLQAYSDFPDNSDRNRLFVTANRKNPDLAQAFRPAQGFQERKDRIVNLRRNLTNPDIQFFLALLLNIPDQRTMFQLIRSRYVGGDPLRIVERWLEELSRLGVFQIEHTEASRFVFKNLLSGTPLAEIEANLRERLGYHADTQLSEDLILLAHSIRDHWLLAPLFAGSHPESDSAGETLASHLISAGQRLD